MTAQGFAFDGLRPWTPGSGLIECETGGHVLDLHGWGWFLSWTFRADARLALTWRHHDPRLGPPLPHLVVLAFADVRDLRAVQEQDWDVRCADDTHGWDYWPDGSGRAELAFDVGDSALTFTASGVRLSLRPVPGDDEGP